MNYWKNGPGKGKVCVASLVGWTWMSHSIQFQAKYREKSTYSLHRKHTECDTHSHLVASVSLGAASVVMLSIILEDAILQNHILFCLSV